MDWQAGNARELLLPYQRDLGFPAAFVSEISRSMIRDEYWDEMAGLASTLQVPIDDVVCGNLYYDALKAVLVGCAAFAVDTPAGAFTTIGWPGFAGVFSGIAPGRFAVTLNAVISDEPLQMASPVVFLLREVLETAPDFQAALRALRETPLASDSLLLLTGVRAGEMAVVERTPTRAEVRWGEHGLVAVTNDYRLMQTGLRRLESALATTACGRFERVSGLIRSQIPENAEDCFRYLSDAGVRMGITVQQMVFQASSGLCLVR